MSGPVTKPEAELDVTPELVRVLLRAQHPDLADLPIEPLGAGWDNALLRVGDDLIARLPRREAAVPLVAHELRWLPALAAHLPLPTSAPVRSGVAGCGYPWPWSLVPWIPGEPALHAAPSDPIDAALALGTFVAALHRPAPADAPVNPYRGIPLVARDGRTRAWIEQLSGHLDAPTVTAVWEHHVALPPWEDDPVWLHGDLHPNNVLVHEGHISGIIDFGDLTAGDPATDLAIGWMLLPPHARPTFRRHAGVDDLTWERGRGWALTLGLAYLAHSADDEAFERVGTATIAAVLADTPG